MFADRPGRNIEDAAEILTGFNGIILADANGGQSHQTKPVCKRGEVSFVVWVHCRRKWIAVTPRKGSPIGNEAPLRIAALNKAEHAICGIKPNRYRAICVRYCSALYG